MVKKFLVNLLLSFIWITITGSLDYSNFLFGFLLGFFFLWVMNKNEEDRRYFYRGPKIIGFAFYFLSEMIKANIQVAYDVITPKYFFKPGIVRFPLTATSDLEINLISMFISLTPGTILLDVTEDKKWIFIHVMYMENKEKFISRMKYSEGRILEIVR